MTRTDHLRRLLAYEGWANDRIFAAAQDACTADEHTARLLSHLLQAHAIWLARVAGGAAPTDAWQVLPWAELAPREAELRAAWLARLEADDLDRLIAYRDLHGNPWTTPLGDILQHVLNHSTYHRGQIAARLVALGCAAPVTDFIAYCRL